MENFIFCAVTSEGILYLDLSQIFSNSIFSNSILFIWSITLREKCLYSEFPCPVFSHIWTEYGPEKLRAQTLFMQCKLVDPDDKNIRS